MRVSTVALTLASQHLLLLTGIAAALEPAPQPPYRYLGCYDGVASGYYSDAVTIDRNVYAGNPAACQSACDGVGAPYVYMYADLECLCQDPGSPSSPPGSASADSSCDISCSANLTAPCGGGSDFITLYGGRAPGVFSSTSSSSVEASTSTETSSSTDTATSTETSYFARKLYLIRKLEFIRKLDFVGKFDFVRKLDLVRKLDFVRELYIHRESFIQGEPFID
ncbi:wsc domain containing protein [Colletotrichum musicola]|uniref:Wsc domain containing protein n=1 Tax=Colletotrichum musicola TaxID=2175873 RepID=A0A8H6NBK4_9PEZI|nr:wsc domain containing protein [Colletotrichum musicola]